jgi:hypothetical protein
LVSLREDHSLVSLDWITGADVPFRAWAATSLLLGRGGSSAQIGKQIVTELADDNSKFLALEHADIAGYSILATTGILSSKQLQRLLASIPFPHADRHIRSKFFGSSTYVYLFARGLGRQYEQRTALVELIRDELSVGVEQSEPDLADLLLLFAAHLELAGGNIEDPLVRRLRGRVAGAPKHGHTSLACRWLLEVYDKSWPQTPEAMALRDTLREYVESVGVNAEVDNGRPAILAMSVELFARQQLNYKLVSNDDRQTMIAQHLGKRRWVESAAYVVATIALIGLPMAYLCRVGAVPTLIAWSSALGLGVPVIALALRAAWGRSKQASVLGPAITSGAAYYAAALYGAYVDSNVFTHLRSEGILLAAVPIFLVSVWAPFHDTRIS